MKKYIYLPFFVYVYIFLIIWIIFINISLFVLCLIITKYYVTVFVHEQNVNNLNNTYINM